MSLGRAACVQKLSPSIGLVLLFLTAMSNHFPTLLPGILAGDRKSLARAISLVENRVEGYETFLQQMPVVHTPVIGITGPPGAGKSTLVDALIGYWAAQGKSIGVLCVDPSSPFNLGALLGDRIRMSEWYTHPHVFIRSLATRGSLGGLHPQILEITDIMKVAGFDYIIVETVGVGQSEVEIAGLADTTVVVVVPEAGDEVQTMKAGLMEIADVFVVNKADRPDADLFARNLRLMMAPAFQTKPHEIAIVKTEAHHKKGVDELANAIEKHQSAAVGNDRRYWLLAEKAWHLIMQKRMRNITKEKLRQAILNEGGDDLNLYRFIEQFG
jgi:LAO/AO transport system kinase